MSNRGNCLSCNADVFWVKTQRGNTMPVDVTPTENGNVYLRKDLTGQIIEAEVWKKDKCKNFTGPLYTSHFATCPQAGKWRKK
jgi:hypothetical protein